MPGDGVADAAASATSRRWLAVRLQPASRPAPESPESIATRREVIETLIAHGAGGVHEDGLALVAHYREGVVNEGDLRSSLARASAGAHVDILLGRRRRLGAPVAPRDRGAPNRPAHGDSPVADAGWAG